MSRNSEYEQRQKAKGLVKKTVWIPESASVEFSQMAEFCCQHKGHVPFMARDIKTGKMKKAV